MRAPKKVNPAGKQPPGRRRSQGFVPHETRAQPARQWHARRT